MLGKPYVIRGLLQMDDPEHATYRAVAQPSLTPAALASMEPWLEEWADQIVSRIASRTGSFDFTKEIAVPFSLRRHHAPALGLPEADDDLILKLSWGLVGPEDPVRCLADHPATAICRAGLGFQAVFRSGRCRPPWGRPRHDLSSVIASAQVEGEAMPDYERFSYYAMLATGGHDTIAFCLSGGMHALIDKPGPVGQVARLSVPDPYRHRGNAPLDDAGPAHPRALRRVRTSNWAAERSGPGKRWRCFSIPANRDETVFAQRGPVQDRPPSQSPSCLRAGSASLHRR